MCGRYTNTVSIQKLAERFGFKILTDDLPPSFNIAPGQKAPVVVRNSPNRLEMMRWGLVPSWAKEEKIGYKMINARSETVHEKPSFRKAFAQRRCLVLADGFFEWQPAHDSKTKTPMRICLKDRSPFAFAGLWEAWDKGEGEVPLHTFTIITTAANKLLESVHPRMPVILSPKEEDVWLNPEERDLDKLKDLLDAYPQDLMEYYPVSTVVNSPRNNVPECIEKLR